MEDIDLMFVYGTLTERYKAVRAKLGLPLLPPPVWEEWATRVATGVVTGYRLVDVGTYPGLVRDEGGGLVYGDVFQLRGTKEEREEAMRVVDEYEGISSEDEEPHEYTRQTILVRTTSLLGRVSTATAWAYIYNWSSEGLKQIPSGDYGAYLQANPKP